MDARQDGCKTERRQDRREARQDGCKAGQMKDKTDAGQRICGQNRTEVLDEGEQVFTGKERDIAGRELVSNVFVFVPNRDPNTNQND